MKKFSLRYAETLLFGDWLLLLLPWIIFAPCRRWPSMASPKAYSSSPPPGHILSQWGFGDFQKKGPHFFPTPPENVNPRYGVTPVS